VIYRYHIFDNIYESVSQAVCEGLDEDFCEESEAKQRLITRHYTNAVRSSLDEFPEKLLWVLDDAEIHNEIVDPEKQEAYLKITTNLDEIKVSHAVQNTLRVSGLYGTRLV
jgi:hypothetical protein